jgi:hypothetical protein
MVFIVFLWIQDIYWFPATVVFFAHPLETVERGFTVIKSMFVGW